MPTNRRKRSRTAVLDDWKLDQLATGECLLAGVGYAEGLPNGCNHWSAEDWAKFRSRMREDWALHGPSLMAAWAGSELPWAAREFGGGND